MRRAQVVHSSCNVVSAENLYLLIARTRGASRVFMRTHLQCVYIHQPRQFVNTSWPHSTQTSSRPTKASRPSAVVTHSRTIQGGSCRTCWVCPHSRSATQ